MKTPEQIAREAMDKHYGIGTDWEEPNEHGEEGFTRAQAESDIDADEILAIIRKAIEADREQRDIVAQIAEVLDDRGAERAAELVRDTDPDDDLWNNYIGPMIDSIQEDYTISAAEIDEEGQ